MTRTLCLLVIITACNPQPSQTEEVVVLPTVVVAPSAPPTTVVPTPEPVKEVAPKAKEGKMTEGQCKKLNKKFTQCGWRCSNNGGNPGYCVNQCSHLLTKQGRWCIQYWGLDFS